MSEVPGTALYGIRVTRAEPPGSAGMDGRRGVYSTSLAQFEELIQAAEAATAQTRPISLFYALSQAGRAIASAHLDSEWHLKGHGLSAFDIDKPDLAESKVRPKPGKAVDSFVGVARATGSESLNGSVGTVELWASLPYVCGLIPETERRHRMPLGVALLDDPVSNLRDWRWVRASVAPLAVSGLEEAEAVLAGYRHGRTAVIRDVQGLRPILAYTEHGQGLEVCWQNPSENVFGERAKLEQVAPVDSITGTHWLRPELSDGSSPSELTTWWALLYALSMLARYEPATWSQVLDYDRSIWAAPLGELLRIGTEAVPRMVLSALQGPPPGVGSDS